jgi:hypothetical protein
MVPCDIRRLLKIKNKHIDYFLPNSDFSAKEVCSQKVNKSSQLQLEVGPLGRFAVAQIAG